jgi:hypothetical protein
VTGTQDPALLDALKHGARALREAGIDHAVGGGIAVWARGGPPTEHDIDFVIREDDVDVALRECERRGMRTATPPEGWLVKAWHEDVLIDLIFRPTGITVDDAFFARCETMNVAAITMPVMPADDIMTTKLFALTEHQLDYGPVLEYARSLREQIDWPLLERRTQASPFARAFFTLVTALNISGAHDTFVAGAAQAHEAAVRSSPVVPRRN